MKYTHTYTHTFKATPFSSHNLINKFKSGTFAHWLRPSGHALGNVRKKREAEYHFQVSTKYSGFKKKSNCSTFKLSALFLSL